MKKMKFLCCLALALVAVPVVTCSCGDDDDDVLVIDPVDTTTGSFAFVNTNDYTQWVYFNLKDESYTSRLYSEKDSLPEDWVFALHRYDCKTNSGAALETPYTSLAALTSAISSGEYTCPPDEAFAEDEEAEIVVDMTDMMNGNVGYDTDQLNPALSQWIVEDISQMPPIYTLSGKVYLIRMADGTLVAVLFTGYTNPYSNDAKGYISFQYLYPITF
ncbi:MAG: HmuY family protein [Prevotellaceae bacterium]|nr:HmuY family protein [Prevotellaceae bacterium]